MRQAKGIKSALLRGGMQAAAFLVVGVLVFSPFSQIFETPIVQAALGDAVSAPAMEIVGGGGECAGFHPSAAPTDAVKNKDGVLVCPSGFYDPKGKYPTDAGNGIGTVDGKQKVGTGSDMFNSIASFLAMPIYLFTVGLGGFAASIGAYFFNIMVHLSLTSTAYGLDFVSAGWETARDLANMFFILILIYLAVTIMLEADTGKTMHTLVRVLLIALVINFSFFATRVVIDAGNFTAVQFYNQIDSDGKTVFNRAGVKDLSASIMDAVGAHQIIGSKSFGEFQEKSNGFGEFVILVVIYFFLGAAYFVLAAAFVATGIKFLMRIAVLWLTIIASPLALVASTMPEFHGQFKQWRDALIAHTFFPVVFLFIFWLISLFAADLNLSQAFNAYNTSVEGAGNTDDWLGLVALIGNVCVRLGFIVAMLYLGLSAADKLGVMGAGWANSVGNKFSLGGINAAGRLGGYASNRIGPGAWAGALDDKLKNSRLGNTLLAPLRNYVTKPIAGAKIGGAESRLELVDRQKKEKGERNANLRDVENREAAEAIIAAIAANRPVDPDHESRIRTMGSRELSSLTAKQAEGVAHLMTSNQMQAVEKIEKYSEEERERISKAWGQRGTRANRLNGQFGSDQAHINRADKHMGEIATLQGAAGFIALNTAPGTRITGTALTDAIQNAENEAGRAQVLYDTARAAFDAAATARAQAATAGNAAAIVTHDAEMAAQQTEMTAHSTHVRNVNRIAQKITQLNTVRPDVPQGEFEAR